MKNRVIGGIVVIAGGLFIALGPQFLFKVCPPAGDVFMKCHWSARAEIGIGGLLAVLGIGLAVSASMDIRLGLTAGIFFSAILALLIPHVLIGGCPMPSMPCRTAAFPSITVLAILLLIFSALNAWYLFRGRSK
jgi:hypothetical protein